MNLRQDRAICLTDLQESIREDTLESMDGLGDTYIVNQRYIRGPDLYSIRNLAIFFGLIILFGDRCDR